jgi:hypothetical protein
MQMAHTLKIAQFLSTMLFALVMGVFLGDVVHPEP